MDLDPELGILDEEAEAWVGSVDKKISKKLKEKEIKRQEHIYEFIITEKHHCLTLKVMQKVGFFCSHSTRDANFERPRPFLWRCNGHNCFESVDIC